MPPPATATTGRKTVVELDLVGYSDVSRTLEDHVGVQVVAQVNEQIQEFVDTGLKAVGAERERVVLAMTGDGAIVAFENADDAHRFAVAVHKATEAHNRQRTVASAKRWFRVGIATGNLYQQPRAHGGQEIAGTVIANAVRLEAAARPGQIVVDAPTFNSLLAGLQKLYGLEEQVRGKRDEQFAVHRCTVVAYAGGENSLCTVEEVFDLFDRLNPRDQLGRLMITLGMPPEHRPGNALTLFERQNTLVDWALGAGGPGLQRLCKAVRELVRRQRPSN